ncbi:MAG: patatin-like phospholipase family protein [Thermincola sp.]|jgi:NTE family protein|nr:patatin-like phospholipase family protein [Thermincola sp.]
MKTRKNNKLKANAVFEGGGVKGIGIAGALTVAERYYDFVNVAGSSAGAIIASLVAAGYNAEEITEKVLNLDYNKFVDSNCVGQMPLVGPLLRLKFNLGVYRGNYIENWVRENLKEKGVERFGDLVINEDPQNRQGRYRLQVIASDITSGRMLILPQDIENYGINPDQLDVAKAIRMSVSIPFFFEPVAISYLNKTGQKQTNYIVDGGVLSNFPVWLFDEETESAGVPTFGFKLTGPNSGRPHQITGPLSMLSALFGTMMEAHDNRYIKERNFERTISIPALGVRTTDFEISTEKIQQLYQSGFNAAEAFFNGWDYQGYLRKYGVLSR